MVTIIVRNRWVWTPYTTMPYPHDVFVDGNILSPRLILSLSRHALPECVPEDPALQGLLHLERWKEHRLVVQHEVVKPLSVEFDVFFFVRIQLGINTVTHRRWSLVGANQMILNNYVLELATKAESEWASLLTSLRARWFSSPSFQKCLESTSALRRETTNHFRRRRTARKQNGLLVQTKNTGQVN